MVFAASTGKLNILLVWTIVHNTLYLGSGKTLAYTLPAIQSLMEQGMSCGTLNVLPDNLPIISSNLREGWLHSPREAAPRAGPGPHERVGHTSVARGIFFPVVVDC